MTATLPATPPRPLKTKAGDLTALRPILWLHYFPLPSCHTIQFHPTNLPRRLHSSHPVEGARYLPREGSQPPYPRPNQLDRSPYPNPGPP